jgi:ABC-type transporter MlaC component
MRQLSLSLFSLWGLPSSICFLGAAFSCHGQKASADAPAPNPSAEKLMTKAAADLVREMGEKVFEIVLDSTKSEQEKKAAFLDLLARYFDMEAIGKFLMGPKKFTALGADQKKRYSKALETYIALLYLRKFENTQGSDFDKKMFKVGRSFVRDATGSLSVQSTINTANSRDKEPLRVEWLVTSSSNSLKIQDAMVEDVSMIQTKREEFKSILKNGGVEGLLNKLEEQENTDR